MEPEKQLKLMKEKAEAVQAVVKEIKHIVEAFQYTVNLTKNQGGKAIAAPGLGDSDRAKMEAVCQQNELVLLTKSLRDHISGLHTGFTIADWGIAETGTLVLDSTSEDIRIATMLAETHVAVLPASKIKPDSMSLANELNAVLKRDASIYYAFITGASRTADIERVLAVGVHGPKELHILIMEENNA
jgi:L-lactate dehydrogenase complex protein LldG